LELKEKLKEAEDENEVLEQEHLAMLKQKGQDAAGASTNEANGGRKGSQNFVDTDEVA